AWIAKKLRELLTYAEPKGDFFAPVPDATKQRVYPSTVAYIATLVLHRFARLGILDADGYPLAQMGLVQDLAAPAHRDWGRSAVRASRRRCDDCGSSALIRVDGCDRCTACGAIGVCG
ncbi:MAG: ribonucleoside-diphosphate reductase, adenosylcobalamin-dependent, partial [Proteobacteria bacterium]|nr:ribonucleoside-diphosphate reductase, adenosylcobalamin-dependent [Pseudomonadota bacterium]